MNRKMAIVVLKLWMSISLALGCGICSAAVITFEGMADMTSISNQLSPIDISNGVVFAAGVSLNELEFPPRSGTNVLVDLNGPIRLTPQSAQESFSSFAAYFTYMGALTVAGYDAANNLLGSVNSLFASNLAYSGDTGSSANELIQLSFNPGVQKIIITGSALGGSFAMDDLEIALNDVVVVTPSIPEPSTTVLFILGFSLLLIYRQRRQHGR